MPEYATWDDYIEHIRRTTARLSGELFRKLGTQDASALAVAALCEESADLGLSRKMDAERAEIAELDLALLPPVSASPFDEE